MNKLEKAISLTMSEDQYINNMYGDCGSTKSMEEMELMGDTLALTEQECINKKIIYQGSSQGELLNQLRDIRTALNKTTKNNNNLIMISSVEKNSGTSFFTRNIAAVTSFDSSKSSLLLDCNISNPSVSDTFGLGERKGILDYIYDTNVSESEIINPVGVKRYRCVTAGNIKMEGEEYFTHPRFRALLTALKSRYQNRNIFIDAPSLLGSANARILLEMCDQVILVVPLGKVGTKKLEAAAKIIPKEKFSGVVINDYF